MNAHAMPSAEVARLPVRPRPRGVVSENEALAASGIRAGNRPFASALSVLASPKRAGGLAAIYLDYSQP